MSDVELSKSPQASFCMSTFKRPELLRTQIELLLQQSFQNFEIVISDNDHEASARTVVEIFQDPRIKYHPNGENLGMVKSFNKSIERAKAEFIVMITDDDPVDEDFLSSVFELEKEYPGFSIYAGFKRKSKDENVVEVLGRDIFFYEILDTDRTTELLWSSCLIRKDALIKIGKLADYGGGHLVDHAMISMAGSINGGVVINKMFSKIVSHENNYSKSNLEIYATSCEGFYNLVSNFCRESKIQNYEKVIKKHLRVWFIQSMFNVRKFYSSGNNKNQSKINEIDKVSKKIMALPYMKHTIVQYNIKLFIFFWKDKLGLIR